MKKRIYIACILLFIILIISQTINMKTEKISTIENEDNVSRTIIINNNEIDDETTVSEIIRILKKYETKKTYNPFPMQSDVYAMEINYMDNYEPRNIILGELNIIYESADESVFEIIEGDKLLNELKELLKKDTFNKNENENSEEIMGKKDEIVNDDEPEKDYLEEYKLIDPDLEVDEELQLIYDKYEETYNDELLRELEPIDIFKLHNKAVEEENVRMMVNLTILPPEIEKEELIKELKDYDISMKNSKESVERYKNEAEITITVSNENMVLMRIGKYEGLRFEKNEEGIWKLGWLARQ